MCVFRSFLCRRGRFKKQDAQIVGHIHSFGRFIPNPYDLCLFRTTTNYLDWYRLKPRKPLLYYLCTWKKYSVMFKPQKVCVCVSASDTWTFPKLPFNICPADLASLAFFILPSPPHPHPTLFMTPDWKFRAQVLGGWVTRTCQSLSIPRGHGY